MKTFYIEDLDFEKTNKFLDEIELSWKTQIYINSGGGDCSEFNCIIDRLNSLVDQGYDISLRCMFAGSMAFNLLLEFKSKVYIEKDADGIVHRTATGDSDIFFHNGEMRNRSFNPVTIWRDAYNKGLETIYEYNFLTQKEREEYNNWMDIYISPPRMVGIFENKVIA